jgi:hypothetical protein
VDLRAFSRTRSSSRTARCYSGPFLHTQHEYSVPQSPRLAARDFWHFAERQSVPRGIISPKPRMMGTLGSHGQECCCGAAPTSTGSKFGSGYCSSWMPSIGFLMSVPFVCKSNLRNLIFNAEVRRNSRQCPHKKAWISAENYFLPHWVALGDSWGHLGAGFRQWPKPRVRWCPLSRAPPL